MRAGTDFLFVFLMSCFLSRYLVLSFPLRCFLELHFLRFLPKGQNSKSAVRCYASLVFYSSFFWWAPRLPSSSRQVYILFPSRFLDGKRTEDRGGSRRMSPGGAISDGVLCDARVWRHGTCARQDRHEIHNEGIFSCALNACLCLCLCLCLPFRPPLESQVVGDFNIERKGEHGRSLASALDVSMITNPSLFLRQL